MLCDRGEVVVVVDPCLVLLKSRRMDSCLLYSELLMLMSMMEYILLSSPLPSLLISV
jgi:hypothetical protein